MTDIILRPAELMPALTMTDVAERRNTIVQFTRDAMKDGIDFGIIPGTGQKPTLLKPGAEKLCTLFGLTPTFETTETIKDWTGEEHAGDPLFYFEIKCKLFRAGYLVAEGDGLCHSWEKKYRYREAKRACPDCGLPTIIKGRKEFGGGWLCFKKQGGCGAKFFDGDATIESQEIGQVSNPDMPDLINTIKKMAVKRALVAAILIAVNASEFFTQDIEDQIIDGHYTIADTPPQEPPSRPIPRTATQELFDEPTAPDPRQPLRDELRQLRQELAAAGGRPSNLRSSQVMAMTAQDLKEEIALTRDELKRLPVEQQELVAA